MPATIELLVRVYVTFCLQLFLSCTHQDIVLQLTFFFFFIILNTNSSGPFYPGNALFRDELGETTHPSPPACLYTGLSTTRGRNVVFPSLLPTDNASLVQNGLVYSITLKPCRSSTLPK